MSKPIVTLTAIGPDGKKWQVHACPTCRRTCIDEQHAEECCVPRKCACGALVEGSWISCEACRRKQDTAKEEQEFAKAAKVQAHAYTGPVYCNDEYYADWETLFDSVDDPPEYAWACKVYGLELDANDIIDAALEAGEHHESAWDAIDNVPALQQALDAWVATQSVESWMVDYDLAVILGGECEEEK